MEKQDKPKVFVITPFGEDFLALYEKLKETFSTDFLFTNAGDLDNQQNILQDIVNGIHQADVIIADLTGLNPNVFYELGLAHAMNKKVIIITQDLGSLPFDIKSYRANAYSTSFHKIDDLIEKLRELLLGAINNTKQFGNPVSDYIPDFYSKQNNITISDFISTNTNTESDEELTSIDGEGGVLDYIADIGDNSNKMVQEINDMASEMNDMTQSINDSTNEINRVKEQSGNADVTFVRNVCRKLSNPINIYASKLKSHIKEIKAYWDVIENSYLSLFETKYMKNINNKEDVEENISSLTQMQHSMSSTDSQIEDFIVILRGSLGMERRLNKAITSLISELEEYLLMTQMMYSSIDRIVGKAQIILDEYSDK